MQQQFQIQVGITDSNIICLGITATLTIESTDFILLCKTRDSDLLEGRVASIVGGIYNVHTNNPGH